MYFATNPLKHCTVSATHFWYAEMTSRRSSGSMRAERAVEPTKSENITVTCRRSARSSGGMRGVLTGLLRQRRWLGGRIGAQGSDCMEQLHPMPECRDAKLLQVLFRQARKNRLVYLILAEGSLVFPEAQAPQPDYNVHDRCPSIMG